MTAESNPLSSLTVDSIRSQIAERRTTATALTSKAIAAVERREPELNAYLTLCRERALEQATRIDRLAERGDPLPPLAGVPLAIKDIIATRGVRTTCGSKILEHYTPVYDATAVKRLESAGAVLIGKTNCDEFAMGSSTENSAYGPVRNPRDLDRVPGGSSGGTAAAVADGAVVAGLGSDTGGSIRQPAAFCGIVGLLPTYGRVSRYGLVAFGSSLDHIGPMSRNAKDAAHVLQVIAGRDPQDSTSADQPVPNYAAELDRPLRGLRIGIDREAFNTGLHTGIASRVDEAIAALKTVGCEVSEIELPYNPYAIAIYYILATAEASANLARYDGVKYGFRATAGNLAGMYRQTRDQGFGNEVKRRILLGTFVLSSGYYDAYYNKALQARRLLTRDLLTALNKVDVVLSPTTPSLPFRIGEKTANPLDLYLADIYTVPADLAGIPAISVPCGESEGLPVGIQFVGRPFDEATLLRVAHQYEHQRAI